MNFMFLQILLDKKNSPEGLFCIYKFFRRDYSNNQR